jgi:hypothetical protein
MLHMLTKRPNLALVVAQVSAVVPITICKLLQAKLGRFVLHAINHMQQVVVLTELGS